MRLLLTVHGSKGDLFPVLGFGRAVSQRGHTVVVITSEAYAADVRQAGLDFEPVVSATEHETLSRIVVEVNQGKKLRRPRLDEFLSYIPERIYRAIERAHVPGESVIGASEGLSFGAAGIAAEKLGIPHASVWHNGAFLVVAPMFPTFVDSEEAIKNTLLSFWWVYRRIKRRYNAVRRQVGLKTVSNILRAQYSQHLNIGLFPFPRWFAPRFAKRLPEAVLGGYPLYTPMEGDPLPAELAAFLDQGEPPIVFTNPSWGPSPDFFRASVAACETLGKRGVLITQGQQLPAELQRPFVRAFDFVPLGKLLQRSAAVVQHGGLGTIATALTAGVPQLLVPVAADQPYNTKVLVKHGAAMTLSPREYPAGAAACLRELLASRSVRSQCERLAREIAGQDFKECIDRLEQLAAARPAAGASPGRAR